MDISEGMLAGRQCPLKHKLGGEKDIYLGGQEFKLKVNMNLTITAIYISRLTSVDYTLYAQSLCKAMW